MNKKYKRTTFIWSKNLFSNIINVFIVTFEQFKASLLDKNIVIIILIIILPQIIEWLCITGSIKNIKQQKSTNKKWAANQYITIISEVSCDTEDWSKFSSASHNYILKYFSNRNCNNISQYYFFTVCLIK